MGVLPGPVSRCRQSSWNHLGVRTQLLNREQNAELRITSELEEAIKTTSKSGSGQHRVSLSRLLNCGVRAHVLM